MRILLDNYDSFTFNIVHALEQLGADVRVFRNDRITVDDVLAMEPEQVIISPGPGSPQDAGISNDLIRACAGRVPLLGVCLGHQCLAEVFGGRVGPAAEPVHGKTSAIFHDDSPPFTGLPRPFIATRYHSLIVEPESLPRELRVTARTEHGEIMGLCHARFTLLGVQFHPESILTANGLELFRNFLTVRGGTWHA